MNSQVLDTLGMWDAAAQLPEQLTGATRQAAGTAGLDLRASQYLP